MQSFGLPKAGWTYCPRCNAENMRAVEDGARYECLICGLAMSVTEVAPGQFQLNADSMLTMEEALRYQSYILTHFRTGPQAGQVAGVGVETVPPRRVRMYFNLCRAIGRLFACCPATVTDLKSKGGDTTWTRNQ